MDSGIETLAETILSESLADTHHSNFKTIESTRGNTSQIADSNNNALNHIRLVSIYDLLIAIWNFYARKFQIIMHR